MPDYARSVKVTYPSGRSHPQLVVDEVATAVWAVQMNTLTLHPWPVRTANTDNPDELRLDLDPQPGRDYADAVQAALQLRDLLKELGLTGYVKSSGNRGVHVFTPIRPEHEFLDVRHAAIGIGRELERRAPDLVTMAGGRRSAASASSSTSTSAPATARWPAPTAPVRCRTPPSPPRSAGTNCPR